MMTKGQGEGFAGRRCVAVAVAAGAAVAVLLSGVPAAAGSPDSRERPAAAAGPAAETDRALDELDLHRSEAFADEIEIIPPALTAEQIALLTGVRAEGNAIQQARATVLLASDPRTKVTAEEVDAAIARVDADRARGLWKSPSDAERALALRGDRALMSDQRINALEAYQVAARAMPTSAHLLYKLGVGSGARALSLIHI